MMLYLGSNDRQATAIDSSIKADSLKGQTKIVFYLSLVNKFHVFQTLPTLTVWKSRNWSLVYL